MSLSLAPDDSVVVGVSVGDGWGDVVGVGRFSVRRFHFVFLLRKVVPPTQRCAPGY